MTDVPPRPSRALSHSEYLQTLHRPSAAEVRRISEIQCQREVEIDKKYHSEEEREAALKIQKAYRGHRQRRELDGLTLDPSARWVAVMKEWRYRTATTPSNGPGSARLDSNGRPRAPSDIAKHNWQRLAQIAEHAGAGESHPRELRPMQDPTRDLSPSRSLEETNSVLVDMRYFLEMVDLKHRYGTNLQVYHGEWLRSKTDQNFFYWLDHGDGRYINMPVCSREKLDKERIRYLSKDERKDYLVRVDEHGKLRWHKNDELITTSIDEFKDSLAGIVSKNDMETPNYEDTRAVQQLLEHQLRGRHDPVAGNGTLSDASEASSGSDTGDAVHAELGLVPTEQAGREPRKRLHVSPATILNHLMRASIKPGTWIYVSDTVGRLYVGIKASGAFQHTSFLSGARISSAGLIRIVKGQLVYLSPLSGHYRPPAKSFKGFLKSLEEQEVDLSALRVSRTFELLQGLEYYDRKKKNIHGKVHHAHNDQTQRLKDSGEEDRVEQPKAHMLHATDEVQMHWNQEHKKGIAKLMNDLHLRRQHEDR